MWSLVLDLLWGGASCPAAVAGRRRALAAEVVRTFWVSCFTVKPLVQGVLPSKVADVDRGYKGEFALRESKVSATTTRRQMRVFACSSRWRPSADPEASRRWVVPDFLSDELRVVWSVAIVSLSPAIW